MAVVKDVGEGCRGEVEVGDVVVGNEIGVGDDENGERGTI